MGCWVFWPSRSSVLWLWRWLYRSSSLSVGSEISCRAAARSSVRPVQFCCFFFQAEDGIRDPLVTGVQTCALPISGAQAPRSGLLPQQPRPRLQRNGGLREGPVAARAGAEAMGGGAGAQASPCGRLPRQIGRASCREREESSVGWKYSKNTQRSKRV